jgi:hypothetical protein
MRYEAEQTRARIALGRCVFRVSVVHRNTVNQTSSHGSLPRIDRHDDVCLTIQICANRATRASLRQPNIGKRELDLLGSAPDARFEATHSDVVQCATEAGRTPHDALPHCSSEHLRLLASARFTAEACMTKRTGCRLAPD